MMRLVLSVLLVVCYNTVFPQDTTNGIIWYPAVLLSDTTINAFTPKIATTGDDTIHVTWEGATERWPYSRSTDQGATFTRVDIYPDTPTIHKAYWNQIVARGPSVFNFMRFTTGTPMYMRRSSDAGTTWDSLTIISDSAGLIQNASVEGSTLAVTHSRGGGWVRILRSTDDGDTWTDSPEPLGYAAKGCLGAGFLHLIQNVFTGNAIELEYRRSTDLGDTWQQTTMLSTIDQHDGLDPFIASNGNVVVATWREYKYGYGGDVGGSIAARIGVIGSDSTTWLPEQILTQIPFGYKPALSESGNGFASAWMMNRETSPRAQVRVLRDTSWSPPFDPSGGHTVAVTGIDVALSANSVHVVWESKYRDPDYYVVFYRRGAFQTTDVSLEDRTSPDLVRLEQNYPNPFNPATTIAYSIPRKTTVVLKVYDLIGREVAKLEDGEKNSGTYNVEWDAGNFGAGVYFYRLSTDRVTMTKKAILLK